jgi:uncharacterized protein (TIGR04255 family)
MPFHYPPVSEMSLAVQFSERVPFAVDTVLAIREQFAAEFPAIDIKERIPALGTPSDRAIFVTEDTIRPRWWFVSPGGNLLVQFQDDLVAFNWRKLTPLREKDPEPYPGFEFMLSRFNRLIEAWLTATQQDASKPVSAVQLLYDNVWPRDERTTAEVFQFWNNVGLRGKGPDVRWSISPEIEELGAASRVDVHASIGAVRGETPAARLLMTGFAFPAALAGVSSACDKLHNKISEFLLSLTTEEVRKSWE